MREDQLLSYLLGPSQSTAITKITLPTWPSPPLGCRPSVTIRTILLQLAKTFPPFALFPSAKEALEFFDEDPVLLFHLAELELPT